MKSVVIISCWLLVFTIASGQELYIFTEPASNMPSNSIGLKVTGRFAGQVNGYAARRIIPEVMFGINKNWMLHVSTSVSNYYQKQMKLESGKVYAKYRFYSNDDIHKHFRLAAFADASLTRNPYRYMDASLDGDNNGAQVGLIATQLLNKLAISGSASYLNVFNNNKSELPRETFAYNMINYSLSAGYLLLPRKYVSYNQTNVNVYLEMLGMRALDKDHYSIDLAPALQFIFNSNTKLNVGYRFQVSGNMNRLTQQQWQVAMEHTLFNMF